MWSVALASMLSLLLGCTTPSPDDTKGAPSAQSAKKKPPAGKTAKGKPGAKSAKSAKGKSAKSAKGKTARTPPIGVAGAVLGELKLVDVPPAVAAPAAPAVEAAPGVEAVPALPPTTASAQKTQAEILLTFADGQSSPVTLGKIDGICTEGTPAPVGPEGKQQLPLWAVSCVQGEKTTDLVILQIGTAITVLRAAPNPAGGATTYKPVKRVALVPGAQLARKSG